MKRLKILTTLLVVFIMNVTMGYALKFSPLNYDKEITKNGAYGEFTLTNTGKEPIRYRIDVKSTGKATDVSKLASVYPKILSIDPLSAKSFKVYVDENSDLTEGEYSFLLGITPLKVPQIGDTGDKTNSAITIRKALEIELFTHMGLTKKSLDLSEESFYMEDGKKFYSGRVKNDTKRGYELAIGFTDRNNVLMPTLQPIGRLFHGNETIVNVEIPRNAVNIVFYDYNNHKVLKQAIKI